MTELDMVFGYESRNGQGDQIDIALEQGRIDDVMEVLEME